MNCGFVSYSVRCFEVLYFVDVFQFVEDVVVEFREGVSPHVDGLFMVACQVDTGFFLVGCTVFPDEDAEEQVLEDIVVLGFVNDDLLDVPVVCVFQLLKEFFDVHISQNIEQEEYGDVGVKARRQKHSFYVGVTEVF